MQHTYKPSPHYPDDVHLMNTPLEKDQISPISAYLDAKFLPIEKKTREPNFSQKWIVAST